MSEENKIKKMAGHFFMAAAGVCFAMALSSCASLSSSSAPRFYMLQAIAEKEGSKKINMTPELLISVGPVKVPQYLDRPQIVTINKDKTLQFAQFDRWGESLDQGVARLVREDLAVRLPEAKFVLYPWKSSIEVKYQVVIEIIRMDSEIDHDMYFVAQWFIMHEKSKKTKTIKTSEFRQPIIPQNYTGLATTLSAVCASLSGEIAEALAALAAQS